MAQLTVRNVDDAIAAALKERALKAGRSAEAEHRRILEEVLGARPRSDFFAEARSRRVTLRPGEPSSTELLRDDRARDGILMGRADRLVVDASIALKWIVDEDGSDTALTLQGSDMIAPALLRLEVGNALRTICARQQVSDAHARELFAFVQSAPVAIVDPDDGLERRALDLALHLGHPIYDCVYLALAERTDRMLVTADRRFIGRIAETEHAGRVLYLADFAGPVPHR